MSRKKIKNTLADRPDSRPYNVGYRRPPKGTRFQPGQSGNPNGRPKGAKNKPLTVEDIESIFLEETERLIAVNEAGHRVSMTMTRAVSRSIAMNAASGKYRQQRLYTELAAKFQAARDRREREAFEIIAEYKIEWDRELARRAKLGITGWEPCRIRTRSISTSTPTPSPSPAPGHGKRRLRSRRRSRPKSGNARVAA